MAKEFDALYGGILDSFQQEKATVIPKTDNTFRVSEILKNRAEGYFKRFKELEGDDQASAHAALGTCKELAYIAKMLESGKIDELEAAGKRG